MHFNRQILGFIHWTITSWCVLHAASTIWKKHVKKKQNVINRIFNVFNVECENYFTCETECLIYIFKGFLTRENIENSCATHERSSISNVKATHPQNAMEETIHVFVRLDSCTPHHALCSIRDFKMFKTQTPESRFLWY